MNWFYATAVWLLLSGCLYLVIATGVWIVSSRTRVLVGSVLMIVVVIAWLIHETKLELDRIDERKRIHHPPALQIEPAGLVL